MSVRPQPSVFVPNDKHLSSNKYVDMIYKENVPDIETGKIRESTDEFPRNDRLYIEYLSPSDLTNVTGITTNTKVVFIGEMYRLVDIRPCNCFLNLCFGKFPCACWI